MCGLSIVLVVVGCLLGVACCLMFVGDGCRLSLFDVCFMCLSVVVGCLLLCVIWFVVRVI